MSSRRENNSRIIRGFMEEFWTNRPFPRSLFRCPANKRRHISQNCVWCWWCIFFFFNIFLTCKWGLQFLMLRSVVQEKETSHEGDRCLPLLLSKLKPLNVCTVEEVMHCKVEIPPPESEQSAAMCCFISLMYPQYFFYIGIPWKGQRLLFPHINLYE